MPRIPKEPEHEQVLDAIIRSRAKAMEGCNPSDKFAIYLSWRMIRYLIVKGSLYQGLEGNDLSKPTLLGMRTFEASEDNHPDWRIVNLSQTQEGRIL